ncbi:bulb-type lectin domain-containing protein [Biscogniauxia sp. FL1348]|nr:bulb-type lectin domain-containing protein [Biscogniauxia sp. FL1348]
MSTHSTLGNGEFMAPGTSLWSEDGTVEFRMQHDGKIAVYWGGICHYQNTADQRNDIKGARMDPDGHLRIYDNNGNPTWDTKVEPGTGNSTVICTVQNDGNVVLYQGTAIWASNTQKQ